MNTDQTAHEPSQVLSEAMSEMAAELERLKNEPVPMCHFKPRRTISARILAMMV